MRGSYGIPPITSYFSTDEEANHGSCLPSSGRDSVAVVTDKDSKQLIYAQGHIISMTLCIASYVLLLM